MIGPNLDALAPDTDRVATRVRNGGWAMPSFEGRLSDDEIQAVAEYVSKGANPVQRTLACPSVRECPLT